MNIASNPSRFSVSLARCPDDIRAVQRLRYEVFGVEMGADGAGFDHVRREESDDFDRLADHLLLRDPSRPETDQVVGTYRLLNTAQAKQAGGFYSAQEFDLAPLVAGRDDVLELSRSCIHKDYRGGLALIHLWQALADYVETHDIAYLFGVASFAGVTLRDHRNALSLLHQRHLAPAHIRPVARGDNAVSAQQFDAKNVETRSAMIAMPPLIKAYLRMGGVIGSGAYIDHGFQTVDVCMILDTAQLTARQRAMLGAG